MIERWSVEQVEAIAPSAVAVSAARGIASPTSWASTGAAEQAVWGTFQGSASEPYSTIVDHVEVGFRCTCPSRRRPCKHALALLLMWAAGHVVEQVAPPRVERWIAARRQLAPEAAGSAEGVATTQGIAAGGGPTGGDTAGDVPQGEPASVGTADDETPPPPDRDERDASRDERVARMMAGLGELDRWLDDRIRTGLADPSLARYGTWDTLAARLVDAQAGSLANRIRRLAGIVGASPSWHDEILAELGLLHLLSQAGRRLGSLPSPLADAVATSVGWQVRKADVLAGVPDTDRWVVAGRSDTREDRIEVRRHWLRGTTSGRWALVLSFAAYRQSLDTSLIVGTAVDADLHRYPGPALRALVGVRRGEAIEQARPPARSVRAGCDEIGSMLVAEPWLDRVPTTVTATPAQVGGRWSLTDATGSLPLADDTSPEHVAALLALTAGTAVDITVEWTPHGVRPLTIHLDDRSVDVGPRADESFVSAA